jgi:UDP-N-acetylglucosamine 2-epimerase (non-hydrolysing)/GDP/UDP-N,N'-diacetylbacillosamine 2-epimerase (hydrolysing)
LKRKISVITGSRSEYGILRPVLKEITLSKKLQLYLIVTGMHNSKKFGLTINEIKKDGFKIYRTMNMLPKGNSTFNTVQSLGIGTVEFGRIFKILKPDLNLVLGDRTDALASSLAASHMNIPNAHIHGGDKSKAGIDEYVRHAITKISNIHFAATKQSKKRIINMGENPKFVYQTGSPSIDEIKSNKITSKLELEKKYKIKFSGKDILFLQHPVTTQIDKSYSQIDITLNALKKIKTPIIAILPNSDAGHKEIFQNIINFSKHHPSLKVHSSIPRSDYLGMLKNCGVLIGNSSSGIIEASYFKIPVINLGIRQAGREMGSNITSIENPTSKLIYHQITKSLYSNEKTKISKIYGNGNSSKKIVQILEKIKLDEKLIQKQIYY